MASTVQLVVEKRNKKNLSNLQEKKVLCGRVSNRSIIFHPDISLLEKQYACEEGRR